MYPSETTHRIHSLFRRHTLWLALGLCACDAAPSAPGSAQPASVSAASGAPISAAPTSAAPASAAPDPRALFDRALAAELDGDALEARDRWIALAAQAPDSPEGRYAKRALGGGDTLALMVGAGVLAAVALPAFTRYQERAHTSEATMNLRRLFDGSITYFYAERRGPDGAVLPAGFPPSTELTPPTPACVGGQPVAHMPDPTLWAAPGWQALGFSIEEPFYYQYQYLAEGEGPSARFTVRAIGDLDCDGVLSTFERIGRVDQLNNVVGEEPAARNEEE